METRSVPRDAQQGAPRTRPAEFCPFVLVLGHKSQINVLLFGVIESHAYSAPERLQNI